MNERIERLAGHRKALVELAKRLRNFDAKLPEHERQFGSKPPAPTLNLDSKLAEPDGHMRELASSMKRLSDGRNPEGGRA